MPRRSRGKLAKLTRIKVYRDPVAVAYRYLRRFVGGVWHRGGSHVARRNFGPGIGFGNWRNDRKVPIQAFEINKVEKRFVLRAGDPVWPRGDEVSYLHERFERLMHEQSDEAFSPRLRAAVVRRAWRLHLLTRMLIRATYGPRFALWQGALSVRPGERSAA